MSNNIVFLSGWLEIGKVEPVFIDGQQKAVIHAWVYTDKPYCGGRHPVLLEGKPAEVLLEWAKEHPRLRALPQVVVQGQLLSTGESTNVLTRFIRLLGMEILDSTVLLENIDHLVAHAQGTGPLRGGLKKLLDEYGYRSAGTEEDETIQ
jgi:hypothetical protein